MNCPKCKDVEMISGYEGTWDESWSTQAIWQTEDEMRVARETVCSQSYFAGGDWKTPDGFIGSIDRHGQMSPMRKHTCPKCGVGYSASTGVVIGPVNESQEPEFAEHIRGTITSKWRDD